jgi:transcriptional regulator
MYNIPYFKEKDHAVVLQFMKEHPFALLIGTHHNRPEATQVPLLIVEREGRLFLQGHLMRNTDHHKALAANSQVLCVFTGAHSYVSASWYTDPKVASTWNYMSVHARGMISFLDEAALLDILERTTAYFESNPDSPASYHNLSQEYVQRLASAIIAFEVEVKELDHVFKLSQNRNKESYQQITDQLHKGDAGAQEIADEMNRRAEGLFGT